MAATQEPLIKDLYINGQDALATYGITLDETSLSQLLTPPGMKENIKSSSRLEHGTRVITTNAKVEARQLALGINLVATTREQFFQRYLAFCEVLKTGFIDVLTKYQKDVEYHLEYNSCQQFAQYQQGIAKFMLRVTECNPTDRALRHRYNFQFEKP